MMIDKSACGISSTEVSAEVRSNGLPVVFLVGPTAIGKSRVAIQVAKTLGTEILTADSTQVYRGMDIGTDKPTPAERDGVPHRLIDLVEPDEPFNVGLYRRLALQEIARLHAEGRVPLVVGGTGLYVRALAYGLWEGPPADWSLRRQLLEEEVAHGPGRLWHRLAQVDPVRAATLHGVADHHRAGYGRTGRAANPGSSESGRDCVDGAGGLSENFTRTLPRGHRRQRAVRDGGPDARHARPGVHAIRSPVRRDRSGRLGERARGFSGSPRPGTSALSERDQLPREHLRAQEAGRGARRLRERRGQHEGGVATGARRHPPPVLRPDQAPNRHLLRM